MTNSRTKSQAVLPEETLPKKKTPKVLDMNIGVSIDNLIEYLADNNVKGIHPLIMGEIEKRLIIKSLERSRGNKLQAAKLLGMSRNTFLRKIKRIEFTDPDDAAEPKVES
jgi:Fis family transcriptional regulator